MTLSLLLKLLQPLNMAWFGGVVVVGSESVQISFQFIHLLLKFLLNATNWISIGPSLAKKKNPSEPLPANKLIQSASV